MQTAIKKTKVMMLMNPSRLGNSLPLHKSETAVNKDAYIEETSGKYTIKSKILKNIFNGISSKIRPPNERIMFDLLPYKKRKIFFIGEYIPLSKGLFTNT